MFIMYVSSLYINKSMILNIRSIGEKWSVSFDSKTISILLLVDFLLCVSEIISNCPPDSGK